MKHALIILTGLSLSGCASPTPYGQMGLRGGVDATRIDSDIWRVMTRGNPYTTEDQVRNYTLMKASEIAIENGYPFFEILKTEANPRFYPSGEKVLIAAGTSPINVYYEDIGLPKVDLYIKLHKTKTRNIKAFYNAKRK